MVGERHFKGQEVLSRLNQPLTKVWGGSEGPPAAPLSLAFTGRGNKSPARIWRAKSGAVSNVNDAASVSGTRPDTAVQRPRQLFKPSRSLSVPLQLLTEPVTNLPPKLLTPTNDIRNFLKPHRATARASSPAGGGGAGVYRLS